MRALQRSYGNIHKISEALNAVLPPCTELSGTSIQQAPVFSKTRLAQSDQSPQEPKSRRSAYGLFTLAASLAVAGVTQERLHSSVAYAEAAEAPKVDNESPKADKTADDYEKYRRVRQKRGLPKEIILYQYEVCPFCNKVRAFLDYHNVPYRCVEVNPLTKKQIKWSEYKKVPVVLLGEEVVNDSSLVLSRMACEFEDESSPVTGKKSWFSRAKEGANSAGADDEEEEMRWRRWVDKKFVQLITVNIYRTAKESWQTFDYITSHGNFNFFERQAARITGSGLMYGISGKLIKKYDIQGDLREALYAGANEWVTALGDKPFRGGSKPDLSDLSMFGVIRSVTGTDTFQDLMHKTPISAWYERMMAEVGDSKRIKE